ncbi:MAG: aminotransferase class V-fold PLP-dependent enzyme [bacterium]
MSQSKTNKSGTIENSRRDFIKSTSLIGTTLISGLTAAATAQSKTHNTIKNTDCQFSSLPNNFTYLNSGTEGSMSDCVLDSLQKCLHQWAGNPTFSYELDPDLGKRQFDNRRKIASILGVNQDNICLTDNTTMGMNITILGLNFKAEDRVITTNHEHNAIRSPLQIVHDRQGTIVITRAFPAVKQLRKMNLNQLLDALFPNTDELRGAKALCVSHVYPETGIHLPLKALRERANLLGIKYLIVDGAQAMGMMNTLDEKTHIHHCDFYACPGHKWMNGPPSTGILYIRNKEIKPPEFYPVMSQRMPKYTQSDSQFPMATALQVRGCSNAPGFVAMLEAFRFIQRSGGFSVIEQHILSLSHKVKSFIKSASPECIVSPSEDQQLQSGLTVFFPFKWNQPDHIFTDKKTANYVVKELLKHQIQIRSIGVTDADNIKGKSYALRVSTAYFNNNSDLDKLFKELQQVLATL